VSSVTLKEKDVSGGPAKNISSSESELRSENNPHGGRESGEERGEGDGDVDCIGPQGVAVSLKLCLFGLGQAFRGRHVTLVDGSGGSVAPFVVALAVVTGGMGGPKKSVPELSSRIKGRAVCRGGAFASDLLATALKRRRGRGEAKGVLGSLLGDENLFLF